MFNLENQKVENYPIKDFHQIYNIYDYKKGSHYAISENYPHDLDNFLYQMNYRQSFDPSIIHIEQNFENNTQLIKVQQPFIQYTLYEFIKEKRSLPFPTFETFLDLIVKNIKIFVTHGA